MVNFPSARFNRNSQHGASKRINKQITKSVNVLSSRSNRNKLHGIDLYLPTYLTGPLIPYGLGVPFFFFRFIILQKVGLLGRIISSSQGLCLNTGQYKHRNIHTLCGIRTHDPASERAKTVCALDSSASVTGNRYL
jgi:hypothetical protein